MAEGDCKQVGRKRKNFFEMYQRRKQIAAELSKTRVVLGDSFMRWRALKETMGLKSDASVANFLLDCYENMVSTPMHWTQQTTIPPAVPTMCQESVCQDSCDSSGSDQKPPKALVDNLDDVGDKDPLKTPNEPTSCCKEFRLVSNDSQHEPALCEPSCLPDSSQSDQLDSMKANLMKEKAALLNQKGKFLVNEKHLLQSFDRKCPSCGGQLQMHKVTEGVSVTLNQFCIPCDYTYQWKSCVESDTTAENQPAAESAEMGAPADEASDYVVDVPEVVALPDEDSDSSNESSNPEEMDSDDEWEPPDGVFPILSSQVNDKPKRTVSSVDYYPDPTPSYSRLCTECGGFFDKRRPHTCEHKLKPYCCNICGKRCVNELSLAAHSRIHEATHEFSCKYCQATFKLRADKRVHEQIHITQGKPYKCPDCSETFATNNQRKAHLKDHRGTVDLKCPFCGIEFFRVLSIRRHLLVHTGEKPYKCKVCERGFNQSSHLKSHMRLHTGERPFKCQYCKKSFTHNVSLKSHMQRCHGERPKLEQCKQITNTDESVQNSPNKQATDSDFDSEDKEEYTDDEIQTEVVSRPKRKHRCTGRPIGRPKSSNNQGSSKGTNNCLANKQLRENCTDEEIEEEVSLGNT